MAKSSETTTDQHWLWPLKAAPKVNVQRKSRYVTARDGTRIAVDVCVASEHAGKRLPTILRMTRYYRGIDVRKAFEGTSVTELPDNHANTRRLFLAAGYAWVDMDVRGSGASFGTQVVPWSEGEVNDGYDVVDWIVSQPWSSGRVGSLGISYDGTSAEHLGYTGHPAVRAVAPTFSLFDVFTDVAFPGGVHLAGFTDAWSRFNRMLDDGQFTTAMARGMWHIVRSSLPSDGVGAHFASLAKAMTIERFVAFVAPVLDAMVVGVRAVDDDRDRALIALAAKEHLANVDVHAGALALGFRDDKGVATARPELTIDDFSPHHHRGRAREDLAVYSVSGWRDGAYARAAAVRFMNAPRGGGSKLLLGPWCHGGRIYAAPDRPTRPAGFDLDRELLRWFDWRLADRDDGVSAEPAAHYFVTGEERWRTSATWPPTARGTHVLYARTARELSFEAPSRDDGDDLIRVDLSLGAGDSTRWNTLLGSFIRGDYPDRKARDQALLTYTTFALERDLAMAGHARAFVWLETDATDLALHVYLEEVTAQGAVHHVTEGVLRATHRKVSERAAPYLAPGPHRSHRSEDALALPSSREPTMLEVELLPTAHVFRAGRAVRLVIATSDSDHFAKVSTANALVRVLRSREYCTRIELPEPAW